MRVGFWVCTAIAVAVVARRLFALAYPPRSGPPPLVALDALFASHAGLTLAHIIPALGFVLLTPYALRRTPPFWADKALLPLGVIVGVTAYAMSFAAIGGWIETSAVVFFDSLFLISLFVSYGRRGDPRAKRRWLMRAIAILLGIATTRPVMGVFFATSRLTHLQPSQFFGIAFWIGFSINTLAMETWLRSTSSQELEQERAA
jgi:hypothetical protein